MFVQLKNKLLYALTWKKYPHHHNYQTKKSPDYDKIKIFYNNFASFCIPTLLCASMHTHVGINGVYPTWICANCKPFHIHTHTTYTYIITGVLAYLPVYIKLNSIRLNCIHVKVCTQVSHSNNSRGKNKVQN